MSAYADITMNESLACAISINPSCKHAGFMAAAQDFHTKKRRTPHGHPSLSILTNSPFASSGSAALPQLMRKATHKRTSSKIQPLFLIQISISHNNDNISMCQMKLFIHGSQSVLPKNLLHDVPYNLQKIGSDFKIPSS